MKSKSKIIISLFFALTMLLTGCHEHSWKEATCTDPKTCTECGEIEGEAIGHDITGLSCTNDGVCSRCNTTIKAKGHTYADATCTVPQKCTVCGESEGKALGHTTNDGVCSRCGIELYKKKSGRGDDVISNITVGDGMYRVHFTHSGSGNFIVKAYDSSNNYELLINEIGKYDGYVLLGDGPFSFEIQANGSWTYIIEKLTTTTETSFSGKGDYVTNIFSASSGTWEFTHSGSSNFIVKVYTTDGYDLLINEIGKYDGKKIINIPSGSNAIFEINADGKWTIKPVS